jgi:ketosteroid isomerase-like protein
MNIEHLEIAEKVSSAFSNKDILALRELYHDDAEVWHNYDGESLAMQDALDRVATVFNSFDEVGVKNVRRHSIDGGYVQQHDYVFTDANGDSLSIPCCQVVTIVAGKITRTEAYRDSSTLNVAPSAQ